MGALLHADAMDFKARHPMSVSDLCRLVWIEDIRLTFRQYHGIPIQSPLRISRRDRAPRRPLPTQSSLEEALVKDGYWSGAPRQMNA